MKRLSLSMIAVALMGSAGVSLAAIGSFCMGSYDKNNDLTVTYSTQCAMVGGSPIANQSAAVGKASVGNCVVLNPQPQLPACKYDVPVLAITMITAQGMSFKITSGNASALDGSAMIVQKVNPDGTPAGYTVQYGSSANIKK